MLRLSRPDDDLLQRVLDEQRDQPFTYPAVGATARANPSAAPAGYRFDRFETDLGTDAGDRFEQASEAVMAWVPQRGARIQVYPGDAVAAAAAFVLALPLPLAGWAVAPARVAYVTADPDRCGYAYGTLPGHPAKGEEAFFVHRADGRVRFEVVAFSRPADRLARLGGPVARSLQVRTIRSYLNAMVAATR